jgi:hypothetical protein
MKNVPIIFNGTFTISNPKTGQHRTVDISTQKEDAKFAPGERIISLLIGQDNTTDYKGFGFVKDDHIVLWRKARGGDLEKLANIVVSLFRLRDRSPYAQYGLKLIESCTCIFCNRKLSDPMSAITGIGPECAKARGIDRSQLQPHPAFVEGSRTIRVEKEKGT